jgi:hypothetical protein
MANDKKDSKTIWRTLECQIYYPQVFEQNRDNAEMHSESDGVTKVTLRLSDEQIADLMSLGVPESALGYQTFKDVTIDGENFRAYVAKRPWVSKYLIDETTGEKKVMGAPLVFDYNKAMASYEAAGSKGVLGKEHITPWDMDQDGLIGNGTKAKVKLSIYRGKNKAGKPTCVVTLEAVAIMDLVVYEGSGDQEVRF